MNHLSPVPVCASDSAAEAARDETRHLLLKARRLRLRRIVTWVVGSAALLLCAGLLRTALRAHTELGAESSALPLAAPEARAPMAVVETTPALQTATPALATATATSAKSSAPTRNAHPLKRMLKRTPIHKPNTHTPATALARR